MKRHSFPVALLLCSVLFTGCDKEDLVDTTPYGVYYQLTTSNPSSVLSSMPTAQGTTRVLGDLTWKSGSAVARYIRFRGLGDREVDIRTSAPTSISMIGPPTDLGMIAIPAGDYEEVRFTIELSRTDPFVLTGDFNGTSLVVQLTDPIDIEVDEAALSIAPRTNYRLLTTLNLSRVLSGISAAMLSEAMGSNGQILISAHSNEGLYNIIKGNIRKLGELEFVRR